MSTQPTPAPPTPPVTELRSLDDDVLAYLEVSEQMEQLGAQLSAIRHRLADRVKASHDGGYGSCTTTSGVTVTVSGPNKRFDAAMAVKRLSPGQLALCKLDGYDDKKLKAQLSGVLLAECMVTPESGTPRVTVR